MKQPAYARATTMMLSCVMACVMAGVMACGPKANGRPMEGPTVMRAAYSTDEDACRALCNEEAHCGDVVPKAAVGAPQSGCFDVCARDVRLLKPSVVVRAVACRHATLQTSCYGKDSAFTHGDLLADAHCFGEGAAPYAVDATNRRNWATASCERMLRCQQSDADPSIRHACIEASMNPAAAEDREAMNIVDALRDEVVQGWATCLAAGDCPAAGKADAVEEHCVLAALGKGSP